MKIGKLAKITNCSVETIRYYEKEKLMPEPERAENNYRSYGQTHVERLRFIRNCRALDLNHDEIRHMLKIMESGNKQKHEAHEILSLHLYHVQTRISQLQQLENQLIELQEYCKEDSTDKACGILQGLSESEYDTCTPLHSHGKNIHSRS